jgi:hypothetical protein
MDVWGVELREVGMEFVDDLWDREAATSAEGLRYWDRRNFSLIIISQNLLCK